MNANNELDRLEEKLAASAGQLLQTALLAARARVAGTDLADQITNLTEARLEISARGSEITVQAWAPDRSGNAVLLIGFTADEISDAPCH
jgi:hypothetical protein